MIPESFNTLKPKDTHIARTQKGDGMPEEHVSSVHPRLGGTGGLGKKGKPTESLGLPQTRASTQRPIEAIAWKVALDPLGQGHLSKEDRHSGVLRLFG